MKTLKEILKEIPDPKGTVICKSCGSVIEYTNRDLHEDFGQSYSTINSGGKLIKIYYGPAFYVHCPVCGYCDTPAPLVKREIILMNGQVIDIKGGSEMNCKNCYTRLYPPCAKGIPCCQCSDNCNSRQPCPKKEEE